MNTLTSNVWFLDYIVYKTDNSAVAGGGGGPGNGGGPNAGVIVGAVVAAVVGIAALLAIVFVLLRRQRAREDRGGNEATSPATSVPRMGSFDGVNTYRQAPSLPNIHQVAGRNPLQPLDSAGSTSHADGLSSSYGSDPPIMTANTESSNSGQNQQAVPVSQIPTHRYVSHLTVWTCLYAIVFLLNRFDRTYPYNNPLYPQFDAGIQRANAKSVFTNAQSAPSSSRHRASHRSGRSDTTVFEEDSGVRIPVFIPPAYTPQ